MTQPQSKILAVDDDPVDIENLRRLLDRDYCLRTATRGEQALDMAAHFQPDIILLDNMMPDIDGGQVCRQIRADAGLRHTKIIMISSKSLVSERVEAYEAGADDYIVKPFDKDELLAKIRVYLRLKSVEELDQFKSDVLTLLSHEARTPLNSLLGPAEMLVSEDQIEPEERKLLVEMVHSAAKRLQCFFENVILLSSLKSGKWQLLPTPSSLCDLVREAIAEVARQAEERNVEIEQSFGANPTVRLDREQIRRALTAILDNALRFSPAGASIQVCVLADNAEACLSVTDHGEGIDADYLPHVFEELSDPDIDHHSQGQGLSLAIARQVVLLHNGTLSAESTKGAGATFTIRLPVTVSSEAAVCESATP
ncbi:MAG: hybrid sensor histidine kinase/response regulator [Phycisphaerales bacterium]|nr:MAG: hybrid sensor histidine kinase/response regulator [Phycisphaerales bacterium]